MKDLTKILNRLFNGVARLAGRLRILASEMKSHTDSQVVDKNKMPGIRERLDAVYEADPESSLIDPRITRLQIRSLPEEDW